MGHLDIKHPDVFRKFEKGFYVIRRSSHSWTGLNSDLVTEQTLVKIISEGYWRSDTRRWNVRTTNGRLDHVKSHIRRVQHSNAGIH